MKIYIVIEGWKDFEDKEYNRNISVWDDKLLAEMDLERVQEHYPDSQFCIDTFEFNTPWGALEQGGN